MVDIITQAYGNRSVCLTIFMGLTANPYPPFKHLSAIQSHWCQWGSFFCCDLFSGNCVTGEVCERLKQQWICCKMVEEYLQGAIGRFATNMMPMERESITYSIIKPAAMWGQATEGKLPEDGGKKRPNK